ncbi:MAG: hypothetical protein Athens071426_2 [Parcubacteria group bacterium Athens0714_26]|nr:MAG: hypothetical protein Athens101426_240 [Parcubacteria group bacterium Athens1014_26]TSD03795.1 MAG: hypothetical protein Athens071426_2 [Parcubacteria group bacterium Athens0714_26]
MPVGVLEAPSGPRVLKSGDYEGQTLEVLMFNEYGHLVFVKKMMDKNLVNGSSSSEFHKHLEWLLGQGENRVVSGVCLGCHTRPVTRFSVLGSEQDGYSMSALYTCCDDRACEEMIALLAIGKTPIFLPVRFSSLMYFKYKHDRLQVVSLLKGLFNLPQRINRDIAFQFFSQ